MNENVCQKINKWMKMTLLACVPPATQQNEAHAI